MTKFHRKLHIAYFKACLTNIPVMFQSLDPNRQTLLFFCVSGLDALGALDVLDDNTKRDIIDWVYAQQVIPDNTKEGGPYAGHAGFRGGPFLGQPFDPECQGTTPIDLLAYDQGHIAMTYTSLSVLAILGDDYSRVNKNTILTALASWQQEDGSFCSCAGSRECDMRFVYCAAAICYMLGSTGDVDVGKAVQYINRSVAYDGGIGQGPGLEGHGGSTYCALAALWLWDRLDSLHNRPQLERWLVSRMGVGFQGRPGKPQDTCYSWWCGASLHLLGCGHWLAGKDIQTFSFACQHEKYGGFGKNKAAAPDPLHSFFAVAGLSLTGDDSLGLQSMSPSLAMTRRAAARFKHPPQ